MSRIRSQSARVWNNGGVLQRPWRLKVGDTVAVVSTSWGGPHEFPAVHRAGIAALERLGLVVREYPDVERKCDERARLGEGHAEEQPRAVRRGEGRRIRAVEWSGNDPLEHETDDAHTNDNRHRQRRSSRRRDCGRVRGPARRSSTTGASRDHRRGHLTPHMSTPAARVIWARQHLDDDPQLAHVGVFSASETDPLPTSSTCAPGVKAW
jgi:hypothetical protein